LEGSAGLHRPKEDLESAATEGILWLTGYVLARTYAATREEIEIRMSCVSRYRGWFAAIGLLAPVPMALGTNAVVTIGGMSHELVSGDLPSMFGEPGAFITAEDLAALNDTLLDDGIDTVGHVSLLLAETSRGASLIALFDGIDGSAPGTPPTSLLGVQMTWQGLDTSLVNLDAGGSWTVSPTGDALVGAGAFQWEQGLSFEALALTDLINMQAVEMQLFDLGLYNMDEQVLQLITFGNSNSWEVESTAAFSDTHEIIVDATIVIPAPSALAVLALAGLGSRRRR
jgi:hypothetical protein